MNLLGRGMPLLLAASLFAFWPAAAEDPPIGAGWVPIPVGSFEMGATASELDAAWKRFDWPPEARRRAVNEEPLHTVSLRAFQMTRHEVSVADFRRYCKAVGREMPDPPEWGWEDSHPVVNVSWDDAQAFCAWAGGRLPTEAEWEYAARGDAGGAGSKPHRLFVWGDVDPAGGAGFGNLPDESLKQVRPDRKIFEGYRDGFAFTAPCGSFSSNSRGLHDLAGNAFEWCADWYGVSYYSSSPAADPAGPERGDYRVLRGGSWLSDPYGLRVSYRYYELPGYRSYYVGFRVVRDSIAP